MDTQQNKTLLTVFREWLMTIDTNVISADGWHSSVVPNSPCFYSKGDMLVKIDSVGYTYPSDYAPARFYDMCLADAIDGEALALRNGGVFTITVQFYVGNATDRFTTIAEWNEFLEALGPTPSATIDTVTFTQLTPVSYRPSGDLITAMFAALDQHGNVWTYVGEPINGSNWVRIPNPTL